MKYFLNGFCNEVNAGNYTYIINHSTGNYFKLPKSIWNNILYYIENDIDVDKRIEDVFNFTLENGIILPYDFVSRKKHFETITVQLTSKCNLNCNHCCASEISSNGEINFDILEKILKLNPMVLIISGGEPMLHHDFWNISKKLREKFSGKMTLSTNGTFINEENAKELSKYYDRFDLSVDGENMIETEKIRGIGVYERVINAAKILKSVCNKKIVLSMVTLKTSYEINEFYDLNKSIGTVPLLRELYINDRVRENFEKILIGGEKEYIRIKCKEFATDDGIGFFKCGMVEFQLFFDVKGNFYPCGGLSEDRLCLGNINDADIENKLWLRDRNYIIDLLLDTKELTRCKDCSIRGFCWKCLSEVRNFSKIEKVFDEYCCMNKRKWSTFTELN